MSEKLKEVCAYIRVSTDKQEELSPESQIRLIKDYAEQHNMLLTRIYQEEKGISGKKADKRPAFQEMIATCILTMQSCSGSSPVLPETLMKALIINQSSERNVMLIL